MFEKKYIIIVAIVVCLFVLYYFYDELSSIKKMYIPTYQKTMALEARMDKLEKKPITHKKESTKDVVSTAFTITPYQSDMVKNGNLSVKYAEISESEEKELLKNMEQNKLKQNNQTLKTISRIPVGDISDPKPTNKPASHAKNNIMDFENSETINIKIADLIKKDSDMIKSDIPSAEYQKIYESLNATGALSPNINNDDDDFDDDVVRDISESIQCADIPSENTVSDIPAKTKKTSKVIKSKKEKKTPNSRANSRQNSRRTIS